MPNEKNYTILMTLKNNFHILKSHAPELEHRKQFNVTKCNFAVFLAIDHKLVEINTYPDTTDRVSDLLLLDGVKRFVIYVATVGTK